MTALDLAPLVLDLVLAIGALTLLCADLVWPVGEKQGLGAGTVALLVIVLVGSFLVPVEGMALGGTYVGDGFALFLKRVVYAGGALAGLAALFHGAEAWPRRQGEFYQLVLYSVLGMSLLAGARDLLLIAVTFELMGIPLYVLAAWMRDDRRGVEGALKLYLTGAVSSGVTLFGLSLLVGLSGTTDLGELAAFVATAPSPLLWAGAALTFAYATVFLVMIAVGFKIGVVPFHMWVPDTYQGAPTPVVAFLAVAPKAAGLAVLTRVLLAGDGAVLAGVWEAVLVIAVITLLAGNLLALPQDDVKRLLGYSGVGHMGLLLVALLAGSTEAVATLLFYLAAYLFTTVGAFLVVHAVREGGGDDSVASFDGLGQRSGWLALAMLVFLLSLGGIPFVVGFWAKLYLFLAAWEAGLEGIVVLGALVSVVGLFYYLRVARAMYIQPAIDRRPIAVDPGTQLGIALCGVFVVGMGLWPGPFVALARAAAESLTAASAVAGL